MKRNANTFAGKKVLVTGGLGFIGSNLARRLLELEAKVALVDSLIPEYGGNPFNVKDIADKIKIHISDIRDTLSIKHLIKGQDYLFNLAGQTSHLDSMKDPFTDLEINSRAQLSILEACRKYNPGVKVVFASTRQVYGRPDYLPVDEKHPLRPVDVNGINKLSGEWYHLLYSSVYNIRASVLRLTNTIGPRMRVKDARQTFLGIWIRLLLEKKPFEVWDGSQLRDFTYVDDAVEAFLLAAANEETVGKVFNLGGDCVVSLQKLADLLLEINQGGEYAVRKFLPERKKIDIGDYYSDYKLFQSVTGWKPKTSLREALAQILTYYKKHLHKYL